MNHLVYVNGLGPNYKGEHMYEFIFSDSNEIGGEYWDAKPSHGQPKPPDLEYVKKVGILRNSGVIFDLVQNSDVFGMEDAIDGVIALAWETTDNKLNAKKLVFLFGEDEKTIKDKLYSRDLILEFEKEMSYEIN
jgi:hypothetical protein